MMLLRTNLLRRALAAATGLLFALPLAALDLADEPLFSTTSSVPGNLILTLSVEWPTATTPAYPTTTSYTPSSTFIGYFDPDKCYQYIYNSSAPATSYFNPKSAASSHTCTSTSSLPLWSGNFLNWASMQTLDEFRWVLTGGYRSVDTATSTVLTKTYAAVDASSVISERTIDKSYLAGATPFTASVFSSGATMRLRNLGTRMWISGVTTLVNDDATTGATAYNQQNNYTTKSDAASASATYELYINVAVCVSGLLEPNCVAYGSNYKPEGLMQAYAMKLRYSAFGYLNHSGDTSQQRDGGVMRARMKYIGPKKPVPGGTSEDNTIAEWSASTGVMSTNPDTSDATATVASAKADGRTVTITNSGVMNYLNKFGYSAMGYKSKDPVSEMYGAALRYYRKLGNVASYTTLSGAGSDSTAATWLDGFPVITSWDDPIQYSCQKNFVLGIGDVNTHRDGNLYGSGARSALEPTLPTEIAADTALNAKTATDMVGKLEGLTGSSTLGSIFAFDNSTSCTASGVQCNTYNLAGLAYHAHTVDLRSDLTGSQTVSTYWMDVLEKQTYKHKNQYWLATKYGGFKVPDGFSPYASTNKADTLADTTWRNNQDSLTIGTSSLSYSTDRSDGTDPRPDNYFPGDQPELMRSGLTQAFAKIASELQSANSETAGLADPELDADEGVYSSDYNPKDWSGTVLAKDAGVDSSGKSTGSKLWDARELLEARSADGRIIVTCCNSSNAGLAFRSDVLSSTPLHSRTTYATFASVSGVSSQSSAKYLAYLRGDRQQETANGGVYRSRLYRLGDIVGGKVLPVGPPAADYNEYWNPGYLAFRRKYASRKTVAFAAANDGMVHAFDGTAKASSDCSTCGQELFAFIPSFAYEGGSGAAASGLASLGSPSFTHHFLVDGPLFTADVDLSKTSGMASTASPDWRTLLIGGLGKGGKGYYALDVTDPGSWTSESAVAGKVLWEFTDARMGYSYGAPVVAKTERYGWVVIFTSGFNNSDGKGYFFLVNPRTGALLEAVSTSEGSTTAPLDMAHATAWFPSKRSAVADSVYAGDMQGNLWRLSLTGTSTYASPTKIASLVRSSVAQPVSAAPMVLADPVTGKRHVAVGTGRLLGNSDIKTTALQSIYAIVDGTTAAGGFYTASTLPSGYAFPLTRASLRENLDPLNGVVSGTVMGWYLDLGLTSGGVAERANANPAAYNGIVSFAVNQPSSDVCSPAGTHYNFAMAISTGKSVLTNDNGGLIARGTTIDGLSTVMKFLRIAGRIVLWDGSSTGVLINLPGKFTGAAGLTRLNWREQTNVE